MKISRKAILFAAALSIISANAATPDIPEGYYDSCIGKCGAELLSALCAKVGPHDVISYNNLWETYKDTDADEDGKIWDMYSTKRWVYAAEKCGSYSYVGDCYNREHSMPKSWFSNASPMESDQFHIYPTDGKVNGQRSNYPFGECASGTYLPSHNGIDPAGKLGNSTFAGYSGIVYEPDDIYKGDFARTYFYMAAAYNDKISGWTHSGTNLGGTTYPAFNDWSLAMFLNWHSLDPVSDKEVNRNEVIYADYQHNRNPFIDHPELVDHIWGDKKETPWMGGAGPIVAISRPATGSVLNFGTMAPGHTSTLTLNIKGENLTDNISISSSSAIFTASTSTVAASSANSDDGATISVSCSPTAIGTINEILTLTSGAITRTVALQAEVISGIPALAARDITETSFTARWTWLGDYDYYTLDVRESGSSKSGYPKSVSASAGEYEVTGLNNETTYTYTLSSPAMGSNEVSVTTGAFLPAIAITSAGNPVLISTPANQHSLYFEVTFDSENVAGDIIVSINAPFELSADLTSWSQTITLSTEDDHFYVDVYSEETGSYSSTLTIVADGSVNDDMEFLAEVSAPIGGRFYEDFEAADAKNHGSYKTGTYKGQVCSWDFSSAGIYSDGSSRSRGTYSLRLSKASNDYIMTSEPKSGGLGIISFYGSYWSASDGEVDIVVEYKKVAPLSVGHRADSEWTEAGTVHLDNTSLQQYTVPVNVEGDHYIRLRQTSGQRANIDDIEISHRAGSITGIDTPESLDDWTAYSIDNGLMVRNNGQQRRFFIFNVEGQEFVNREIATGSASFTLPAGFYIVTDETTSRRVVIR